MVPVSCTRWLLQLVICTGCETTGLCIRTDLCSPCTPPPLRLPPSALPPFWQLFAAAGQGRSQPVCRGRASQQTGGQVYRRGDGGVNAAAGAGSD